MGQGARADSPDEDSLLRASVVIPAHDEAAVIERCLDTLLAGVRPGEVEVIVVCNGCSDDTAALARAACPDATVLELSVASKSAALNAGDRRTGRFPRIYLDADIELTAEALRATARALTQPGILCAAPVPHFELHGRPNVVRRYYEVWQQLPYVTEDMVGTGVYGLSASGRARFGEFPAITADDQFVLQQFDRGERRALAGVQFTVHTPSTIRGLLAIRRRAYRGARELDRANLARYPAVGGAVRRLRELARDPRNWASVACYLAVSVYAKAAARLTRSTQWERDSSSRPSRTEGVPKHHGVG